MVYQMVMISIQECISVLIVHVMFSINLKTFSGCFWLFIDPSKELYIDLWVFFTQFVLKCVENDNSSNNNNSNIDDDDDSDDSDDDDDYYYY